MTEDSSFYCQPSLDTSNPKRPGRPVLSSFVFLDTTRFTPISPTVTAKSNSGSSGKPAWGPSGSVYGTRATILNGPPEPFVIFIGSARIHVPVAGSEPRFVTFSSDTTFFAAAIWCTTKSAEGP